MCTSFLALLHSNGPGFFAHTPIYSKRLSRFCGSEVNLSTSTTTTKYFDTDFGSTSKWVGRVVLIEGNHPYAGRLAAIVEIIDHKRVCWNPI
ncbi:hypothetical protein HYQ44_012730 [Verticillium longisporum]|nr:hypothetical protein HYQ44_012730 [Verticillium longisporum]